MEQSEPAYWAGEYEAEGRVGGTRARRVVSRRASPGRQIAWDRSDPRAVDHIAFHHASGWHSRRCDEARGLLAVAWLPRLVHIGDAVMGQAAAIAFSACHRRDYATLDEICGSVIGCAVDSSGQACRPGTFGSKLIRLVAGTE